MKVVRWWSDQRNVDGFVNIYELCDGTFVFASEKRGVHRDGDGNLLGDVYKRGFDDPVVQGALENIDEGLTILPFTRELRSLWGRCIDTNGG